MPLCSNVPSHLINVHDSILESLGFLALPRTQNQGMRGSPRWGTCSLFRASWRFVVGLVFVLLIDSDLVLFRLVGAR